MTYATRRFLSDFSGIPLLLLYVPWSPLAVVSTARGFSLVGRPPADSPAKVTGFEMSWLGVPESRRDDKNLSNRGEYFTFRYFH